MAVPTWPAMQMMGTESSRASARAVRVLVAPGPEVAKNTAGWPVERAWPRTLLVAGQHVADAAFGQRVVKGQVAAARNAGNAPDARLLQEGDGELGT